jgi:ABC-type bacteriocin/lantibiotic exporter with double-glycine peptidase domain
MSRLINLPVHFFRNIDSGELAGKVGALTELPNTLFKFLFSASITLIFAVVYTVQIFVIAPTLAIPAVIAILLQVITLIAGTVVNMQVSLAKMEAQNKTKGITYSILSGIQTIKLAGTEKRVFAKWSKEYAKKAHFQYNPKMFMKIFPPAMSAVSMIGSLIIFASAAHSNIDLAEYMTFMAAYGLASGSFSTLAGAIRSFSTIKPILEIAAPIFDTATEVSEGKVVAEDIGGGITLSEVTFAYSDDSPMIIDDLSLEVRTGEYLGIVGKTGCGKSTILRLLLGFETPDRGAIYYDGSDISKLDLKSLRKNMGVVMQDGKLFQGSLFSNITISKPDATMEEAWEAAEITGIADDIKKMPMGMNTMIGEGAGGISGGQKQRIMIARAVISKPRILLLDEATSSLDNLTQAHITETLGELDCTRIVIAHRLSTIRRCDRIIFLDKGKIAESGTYDELMQKNGLFKELVERQQV